MDSKMLQQLILVLFIKLFRSEDMSEKSDSIAEQLLAWLDAVAFLCAKMRIQSLNWLTELKKWSIELNLVLTLNS